MQKVFKWLTSRAASFLYGACSIAFLWVTIRAVTLFDVYPEFFGGDELFIISMLFATSIIWYMLFVLINGHYVRDDRKKLYNVFFVLLSSMYAIIPICSRPELFMSIMEMVQSDIQSIL